MSWGAKEGPKNEFLKKKKKKGEKKIKEKFLGKKVGAKIGEIWGLSIPSRSFFLFFTSFPFFPT